jgi:hypothetical protein
MEKNSEVHLKFLLLSGFSLSQVAAFISPKSTMFVVEAGHSKFSEEPKLL